MLDQQGPKAEKTKGVLNLNHADACMCIDLDQGPRLWPANSTSTEILPKMVLQARVLCIQIVRLWQRHGGYLQSALEKPDTCH